MTNHDAFCTDVRNRRVLVRLGGMMLLLMLLSSTLVWVAAAQKPEGEEVPSSLPSIDAGLRLKIEPALLKQLIESDGGRVPIIVEIETTPSLSAALAETDPSRRRQAVVATLQATAQESQAGTLSVLAEREASGGAANIRSFWIFNGLAAEADLETVLMLAARPEVKIVRHDREYQITNPPEVLPDGLPDAQGVEGNIAQTRADLVWNAFRVDGTGVVVANIDSGVDFSHPAFYTRYRGYDAHGRHLHACNWFDATGDGAIYPVDANGHGTHTMGTIVGGGGIGMAPGATWIAVRAFDSQGRAYESWLHTAFQWIVNPGPGCSPPDVVNNSWSSSWGGSEAFRTDVQVLRVAGIFAPFSAGNDGPELGSIDAPASYPEAFAVGAVTSEDWIAGFSSRGPSTWYGSRLVKPEVSAPGVNVRSSLPGGTYGENDGTSMAAPHVAGLAALLLQADPSLSVGQIEAVIKETALPLGSPVPNDDFGWGRVDAFAAVAAASNSGSVAGNVTRANDGAPVTGALLTAVPSTFEPSVTTLTARDGTYRLALAPDRYTLTASAFGYDVASRVVEVLTGTLLMENFALAPLPTGTLTGRVTSAGQPVPAVTIEVIGTPVRITTNASGVYTTYLPPGSYTLLAVKSGYRVAEVTDTSILAGETTVRDLDLVNAPTILLVDSGAWYYASEVDYYRQALDDQNYTYDLWTVRDPVSEVPAASDLSPYDIVFWSAPEDSPGYLNASDVLTNYLESGGSLFLSGQDVAYYDDFYPFIEAPYFREYLKARYIADDSGVRSLTGVRESLFEGLTFGIDGPGGADNQYAPDEIAVGEPDFASSAVMYDGGGSGGQHIGHCLPYRAIYLSYGFEAIADAAIRTEVISRSIAWFTATPRSAGVELIPGGQSLVGDFGHTVTHTLRIRNLAETGSSTDFSITPSGFSWATSMIDDQVTLDPCESAHIRLTVQVPPTAAWSASDLVTITAEAVGATAVVTGETRSPAPVLLVDDARWYDVVDHYKKALETNGIRHDDWQVHWDSSSADFASPPARTLQMYPMVVWFSAYDWYQPLSPAEEERLGTYLENGGRLYYNGQDYLYRSNWPNSFAQKYLGVAEYTEDLTSTLVAGAMGSPMASFLGPYDVIYPYRNYSDALTPTDSADVAFVGQDGQPNALTNTKPNLPSWRTTFFAFNPDGLSDGPFARVMQRVTGWLSWLGSSSVTADKTLASDTDTLTYTVVLRNDGWQDMSSAHFTATFTSDLVPIPESVGGGAIWDPTQQAFVWSGPLDEGQSLAFTYQAQIADSLPMGHVVSHTVRMGYDSHNIEFDRIVTTPVNLPVFSQSSFSVEPVLAEKGSVLTYSLQVRNTGVVEGLVTTTNPLPAGLALVPDSLQTSGGTLRVNDQVIVWDVPVAVADVATLTYAAVVTDLPPGSVLHNRATLDDGLGTTLTLDASATVKGFILFPVIVK